MKQYSKPLPGFVVWLVFFGITMFGVLLLSITNIWVIRFGLVMIMYGIHELAHLLVLKIKSYRIIGIGILRKGIMVGMGPMFEPPVRPQDGTIVYLSGLISMVVPIVMMPYFLEFVLLLVLLVVLSIDDICKLWQVKKRLSGCDQKREGENYSC